MDTFKITCLDLTGIYQVSTKSQIPSLFLISSNLILKTFINPFIDCFVSPPNSYIEVLRPSTSEFGCIWRWGL